jgi:hypothetical protein
VEDSAVNALSNAREVEQALRATLGGYNKTKLRQEDYPLAKVAEACVRAHRLDGVTGGGDIPGGNTSRVYRLWEAILKKALPSQLPAELRTLPQLGIQSLPTATSPTS